MDIKIQKKDLVQGLVLASSIVERKTTMPLLANVCLCAHGKTLTLSATDLEVGFVADLATEVVTEGELTVSARSLFDIVKELPDDRVHLHALPNHWMEVKSGKSHFKIVGLSAEEFPKLPESGKEHFMIVDVADFLDMVTKTAYAMSTDETRYTLNGVLMEQVKGDDGTARLRLVATDGHRLAYADRAVKGKWKLESGVIIPRKGILEWKRLLEGVDGTFQLAIGTKQVTVQKDNVTLIIRLIDGQFPPYQQVIPDSHKWVISVGREILQQSIRRVQLVTTDRSRGIRFRISPKHLELTAKNPDIGEAHEELQVKYQGETFEIGFNGRYFLDLLNVMADEQVVMELKGEMGPALFRSEFDRNFLAVIMPMRL
ncbi:MAG: DNA polymerase III subunit beta [Deltaproteobacteria bacterium]|nr:DNA polymerase III subunit beta [Deltaproteobacteria bacterium]